ncbi:MAG: Fic family protein [Porticoccaceae bacterium]
MDKKEPDIKADTETAFDRGEATAIMEPLQISEGSRHRPALTELSVELAAKSAGFRRSLPAGVVTALAELVRAMNCYYSNLIEGHSTHPVDIERAMRDDYSAEPKKRDLQLEARAHVMVQTWIDDGGLDGRAATLEGVCEIHKRFCAQLPDDLLWVEDPDSAERIRVIPGELRARDVKVGNHIPVSAGALPRFLRRFEEVYSKLGKAETIFSAAAAHHRLLWIHPFLDGNGRVARLMSYAMLREALDTGGIWSIARGLARQETRYKQHLIACDQPRRGDMDGRGSRSESALAEFTEFFLQTCIDQVDFMEKLVQPDKLRGRILLWAEEEIRTDGLPQKAGNILEAILYRGELPRGDVPGIVGTGERQARRIVSALQDAGVITSETTRSPLCIAFPAKLAGRWMPGLFPEA